MSTTLPPPPADRSVPKAVASNLSSGTFWLAALVVVGILLRLRQLVYHRSFFLDEALYGLNFAERNVFELMLYPLSNGQSAPVLYTLAAKASISVLGLHDWALRVPSLLASSAVLVFAWQTAIRELASFPARVLFVGLCVFSPIFLYYAAEFKPYAMDACAAAALMWAISLRHEQHGALRLALTGFFGFLSSQLFVFIAVPAAAFLAREYFLSGRMTDLTKISAGWAAGFALLAIYTLVAGVDRSYMYHWWQSRNGFAPENSSLAGIILWHVTTFPSFVNLAFIHATFSGPSSFPGDDAISVVLALLCLPLLLLAFLRCGAMTKICILSILLCMLASAMRLYPFSSRLIIGLIPALFFSLACGVDALRKYSKHAPVLLVSALIMVCLPGALQSTLYPNEMSSVRQALKEVAPRMQQDDVLALSGYADGTYRFYQDELPLKPETLRFAYNAADPDALARFVAERKPARLWILSDTRRINQELARFQAVNSPVYAWQGEGTTLWLYQNPIPTPADQP